MSWRSPIAALAATFAMFLLAGFWNTFVVAHFLETAVDPTFVRTSPRLWLIFLGYLWLGAMMAYLFPRFAPTMPRTRRTVAFAVFVALVWIVPYSFVLHGVYRFPWEGLVIDPLWALIEQGAGAWIVTSILQRANAA